MTEGFIKAVADLKSLIRKVTGNPDVTLVCTIADSQFSALEHRIEAWEILEKLKIPGSKITFYVRSGKNNVSTFRIDPFPSNQWIAVSHAAFVFPDYRRKGIGRMLTRLRMHMCTAVGFEEIMCSVRSDNATQIKILHSLGWKDTCMGNTKIFRFRFDEGIPE